MTRAWALKWGRIWFRVAVSVSIAAVARASARAQSGALMVAERVEVWTGNPVRGEMVCP